MQTFRFSEKMLLQPSRYGSARAVKKCSQLLAKTDNTGFHNVNVYS